VRIKATIIRILEIQCITEEDCFLKQMRRRPDFFMKHKYAAGQFFGLYPDR